MSKEIFRNKYRIATHRLNQGDYSGEGLYFNTMITQHRECFFREIINGAMHLSSFSKIVHDEWHKSFKIRGELFLDSFVIMPNHPPRIPNHWSCLPKHPPHVFIQPNPIPPTKNKPHSTDCRNPYHSLLPDLNRR